MHVYSHLTIWLDCQYVTTPRAPRGIYGGLGLNIWIIMDGATTAAADLLLIPHYLNIVNHHHSMTATAEATRATLPGVTFLLLPFAKGDAPLTHACIPTVSNMANCALWTSLHV